MSATGDALVGILACVSVVSRTSHPFPKVLSCVQSLFKSSLADSSEGQRGHHPWMKLMWRIHLCFVERHTFVIERKSAQADSCYMSRNKEVCWVVHWVIQPIHVDSCSTTTALAVASKQIGAL